MFVIFVGLIDVPKNTCQSLSFYNDIILLFPVKVKRKYLRN